MEREGMLSSLLAYVKERPGRALGTAIGFVIGASLILLGFWRTLVISLATGTGYVIGRWVDGEGKGLKEFLEEKLPGRPDFH